MTETNSIDELIRERHAYSRPVVPEPGLTTLLAQAVVGCLLGSFVMVIARILFNYESYNGMFVFALPALLILALITGAPAGLIIWAGSRLAHGRLHTLNRSLIGVLVLAVAWAAYSYLLLSPERSASLETSWMLSGVVACGIGIGLLTGSRLRLWRELVRAGEADGTVLRILAGLTGIVLRVAVVVLFMGALIAVISVLQTYPRAPQLRQTAVIWTVLVFGHFATGVVVLFVRMRFGLLALLTAIAATPIIASLFASTEMVPPVRYVIVGYLAVWTMFLLARWRQTEVALSALKEELRYYLID